MPEVKVVEWTRNTLPLELLSNLFTSFYKDPPWNEYLRCPKCKKLDDFGPVHSFGYKEIQENQIDKCPECGTELQLFWSEDRLDLYLFQMNNLGEIIYIDEQLAAWWRGRMLDQETLYLDVIAILPEYRKLPFRNMIINYFRKGIERFHREDGVTHFLSRTHDKATHVKLFLKIFGFKQSNSSTDDLDRSYWVINF